MTRYFIVLIFLICRYTIRVKEELDKCKQKKGQEDNKSMPCGNKEYQDKTNKDVSAT